VDDGWYEYWSERCENPLDDAETLMFDENDYLIEIGQKTTELLKAKSQYIYREIYVKVSMDTLRKRDRKGLYSGTTNETEKEGAGIHFHVEEPKHPDLILENDGEKTPEEQVERILVAMMLYLM
jgi:adenylylsulfate kinase-like enzyme